MSLNKNVSANKKKNYFKYIFALLLFGSNGIVASHIANASYEIVLMRTLFGSLLLIAVFISSRQKIIFTKHKKDFPFICTSGVAMGLSWMLLYEAYAQIGVSLSSLLYYCGPVIVMILSPLIFREKLTAYKIIGFTVVLCGIFLVNGAADGTQIKNAGVLYGIASALTYAIMVISNKKSKAVVGFENSMLQLVVSFLTVAVFVGIKTGFSVSIRPVDWIWILVLGLLNTGIGCYLYFSAIGHLPVQTVAICGYLEPLSAVVFSVIFLKEIMLPMQIVGGVLIIGGAVLGELKSK